MGTTIKYVIVNIIRSIYVYKIHTFLYNSYIYYNSYSYASDLIKRMTCTNPTERYSAAQALLHPWVTRRFQDEIPLNFQERILRFK